MLLLHKKAFIIIITKNARSVVSYSISEEIRIELTRLISRLFQPSHKIHLYNEGWSGI